MSRHMYDYGQDDGGGATGGTDLSQAWNIFVIWLFIIGLLL